MTESEAIERLKCLRLYMKINDRHSDSKFLDEDYESNDMAIKALEMQIEMKKHCDENICVDCPYSNYLLYSGRCMNDFIIDWSEDDE